MEELRILYQDEWMLAVCKPHGLLVHPSKLDKGNRDHVMGRLRDQIGAYVYPVHRLDKPTSGVLVMGLDKESAKRLSESFARREVDKQYLAIVRGYTEEDGKIDYPLKQMWDKTTDAKADKEKEAQEATTAYETLARTELPFAVGRYESSRYSLVKLKPLTGRQRQLRRHMKHIFHPIIGDSKHGDYRHNRFFESQFGCKRMLLHATKLSLPHPQDGRILSLEAETYGVMHGLMREIFWIK